MSNAYRPLEIALEALVEQSHARPEPHRIDYGPDGAVRGAATQRDAEEGAYDLMPAPPRAPMNGRAHAPTEDQQARSAVERGPARASYSVCEALALDKLGLP